MKKFSFYYCLPDKYFYDTTQITLLSSNICTHMQINANK